jgi:16S rRNA A1518/A1519 N6-dimethyltransferase RsmA/KsgA/DIM1 with predicted DNA glycosylase/AP lyase activity
MALAPRKKLWSSPIEVIDNAIDCLDLSSEDLVFDLGAGDGKFLFRLLERTTARVVGVEIDSDRVQQLQHVIDDDRSIPPERCRIIQANALEVDLSSATAFYLYLVPRGLRLVLPLIQQIKRNNIRVVTYMSPFPGIEALEVHKISTAHHPEAMWPIYVYVFNNLDSYST